ncbi:protein neprosin-like [Typha angustifolia]|uniref:protein neprosin-like n=1 Tax=Typha angustifolia TaxID=59011 RepID=UPI003C2AEA90
MTRYHLDGKQDPNSVSHWAVYQSVNGEYYGTRAKIIVYGVPDIKPNQVNPEVYGDNDVHLFTYWTADGYKSTGCYDFQCDGFVMANLSTTSVPGRILTPVSLYGVERFWIELRIQKDSQSGDWWLYREDGEYRGAIGYWPKSLFTSLADRASSIEWGGFVNSLKDEMSPAMGSGHFSLEDNKGAYFANIYYISTDGNEITPVDGKQLSYVDREDCYEIGPFADSERLGGDEGWKFFYGGPGGCTN